MLALDRGETARAARLVADEAARLDALAVDANWLYTVTTLGVGAWLVDDASVAAELYPRILPYAERVALSGRGTQCFGSVKLPLGLLAAALGDDEGAECHLADAVVINDRLRARPYAAAARYAASVVLEHRGERERAAALRAEGLRVGRELGMTLPQHIARYF
jgi:hypothetical protein